MDGINKFEIGELKARQHGLRKQLEQAMELLIRRGWWSYLTDFPIIDHDIIMIWVTETSHREQISIHYLFNKKEQMWEIILALVGDVGLSFPVPPGRIQPHRIQVNGDSHEETK